MSTRQLSVRAHWRDTALAVSLLSAGQAYPENAASWYEYCQTLINRLKKSLQEDGYSTAEVEEISYAQCALLDEVALKFLQGQDRDVWEREPLQVHFFASHNAGDVLCDHIQKQAQALKPNIHLIETYSTLLGLGFRGRYAIEDDRVVRDVIARLNQLAPASESDAFDGNLLIVENNTILKKYRRRLSPLMWAVCALAGAVVVYVIANYWLEGMIQQIRTGV